MNDLSYDADPPLGGAYLVEVSAVGPDGVRKRAATEGEDRAHMRLEILDAGAQEVTATLIEAKTWRRMGLWEDRLEVAEFAGERDEAEELLAALRFKDYESGALRKELDRIYRRRRFLWAEVRERTDAYRHLSKPDRRELIADVNRELAKLRREVRCQRLRIDESNRRGRLVDFLPWETEHPWVPFDPETDIPADDLLSDLMIRTDGRAHDAVAVEFANVLMRPLDVRVWFDPVATESGENLPAPSHFTLRQFTGVPTSSGIIGPDAIPELGNAGILRIGPSASARLWIDVETGDLPAGSYSTTLHVRALSLAETTWDVPVTWTVVGVTLPDMMPLHLCTWSSGMTTHFAHAMDAALEDLQNHYNSVYPGLPIPVWTYDADGKLVGRTSWDDLDWYLDRMRPQNILLIQRYPLASIDSPTVPYSDSWKKAFASLLPEFVEHLAQKGFAYDRWAFHPVDEPGLKAGVRIMELERFARFVKSVNPKVRIYTNPYRGMTVADLKRLVDVLDIVQPARKVVDSENPDRIDYIKTTDQIHWMFEGRARAKDFDDPTYYWQQIWTAWEIGFTGIGYWTYCTSSADLWSAGSDFVMVYQGAEGPVPSVRWRALRIGIEDHARLVRLRNAIDAATEAGRTAAAAHGRQRLGEMVVEARAARWDPGVVARIREEVIDLTLELTLGHDPQAE